MTTHIDASVVHDVIVSKRVATYFEPGFSSRTSSTGCWCKQDEVTRCVRIASLFVEIGVSIRFYIMVLLYASEDSVNPFWFFGFGKLTGRVMG